MTKQLEKVNYKKAEFYEVLDKQHDETLDKMTLEVSADIWRGVVRPIKHRIIHQEVQGSQLR